MIDTLPSARSRSATETTGSQDGGTTACIASEGWLTAVDGLPLHYRAWLPEGQPVTAALLFTHGIASHGAWFSETAAFLAERGIAVYAPDRRGSGLSSGRRGHVESYQQALSDLDCAVDLVEERQPGRPIFLAGSSWAAKIALAYAARCQHRLAGLLLHGPGLFPRVDLSLGKKLAVLLLHRIRPHQPVEIPLTPESYTRDPEHLEYIRQDSLRLLTATARFFWETGRLDRARDKHAARLKLPILLQIGDADPIMNPTVTCRWLHNLSTPDRTMVVYKDAWHTLDFEREQTLQAYRADLLGWLRRQIAQTARRQEAVHVN